MMNGGKIVFPNEGVTELKDYINQIKHSIVISNDELTAVYESDGKDIFPSFDDLKKNVEGYETTDGKITIQSDPIVFDIPQDILRKYNSHYDEKDLLEAIGEIFHQKYPDAEYHKQRCIEICGKLI